MGLDKRYPEIPTIASEIDEWLNLAEQIPVKELSAKAMSALEKLDKLMSSPHVSSSLQSMSESMKETRAIVIKIGSQIDPIVANIKEGTGELRDLVRKGQNVPERLDSTLTAAEDAMKQAREDACLGAGSRLRRFVARPRSGVHPRGSLGNGALAAVLERLPPTPPGGDHAGKENR